MHRHAKILVAIALTIPFGGCATTGLPGEDSIEVKQVQASGRPESPYILVTATVAYTLVSAKEAQLSLGLDANSPGRITLVAERPIGQGQGTLTLAGEIAKDPDRQLLAAVIAIDRKNRRSGPPYAYRRISLSYPTNEKPTQPPEPAPATVPPPAAAGSASTTDAAAISSQ